MVRECSPPAREPMRSWPARRSTTATSTAANANSPANMSPVGPPPTTTTAWLVIATLRSFSRAATNSAAREPHVDNNTYISRDSAGSGFGRRFYGMTRVLKQAPYAPHIKVGEIGILLSGYFRARAERAYPQTKPQSPAS